MKALAIFFGLIGIVALVVIIVITILVIRSMAQQEEQPANQDCELSGWSMVGDCETTDISGYFLGKQKLVRKIIKPQLGTGKPCDILSTTTFCDLLEICTIDYKSSWTPTDENCKEGEIQNIEIELSNPNVKDGESGCVGKRTLTKICSKGPVDCVVSDYGPCINGFQKRFVLVKESNGGKKCPSLVQACS
jgi:hypothetical protein